MVTLLALNSLSLLIAIGCGEGEYNYKDGEYIRTDIVTSCGCVSVFQDTFTVYVAQ